MVERRVSVRFSAEGGQQVKTEAEGVRLAIGNATQEINRGAGTTSEVIRSASGDVANLAAQFSDIGVMLASGQSPLLLAVQQGAQIAPILGRSGAAGAAEVLKAALASVVNPTTLITVGAIAAGAAMTQWLAGSSEAVRSLDDRIGDLGDATDRYAAALDASRTPLAALRKEWGVYAEEKLADLRAMAEIEGRGVQSQFRGIVGSLQDELGTGSTRSGLLQEELELPWAGWVGDVRRVRRELLSEVLGAFDQMDAAANASAAEQLAAADRAYQAYDRAAKAANGVTEAEDVRLRQLQEVREALRAVVSAQDEVANAAVPKDWDMRAAVGANERRVALMREVLELEKEGAVEAAARQARDAEAGRALLATIEQRVHMDTLIAQNGAESVEVAKERLAQEVEGMRAQAERLDLSDQQRRELDRALTVMQVMAEIDLASPVKAAADEAERLARAMDLAATGHGEFGRRVRNEEASRSALADVNSAASGGILDLIAYLEGTGTRGRDNYNETLGYGRFTGGDVDLVNMTLAEVRDLQRQMLANPANTFNSSAVGRYQIVGTTLDGLIKQLGLSLNDLFTPALQDRLALELVRQAGGPSGIRATWEGVDGRVSDDMIRRAMGSVPIPAMDPEVARETATFINDASSAITRGAKEAADAAARELDLRKDLIAASQQATNDAQFELTLVGKSADYIAQERAAYILRNQALANGIDLNERIAGRTETYGEMIDATARKVGQATAEQEKLGAAQDYAAEQAEKQREATEAAAEAMKAFAASLTSRALGPITSNPIGGFLADLPGFQTGAQSVFNGLLSGGFGGATSALSTALGGATTGLAGLGTAIGAIAGPVGAAIGLFQGLKGTTEVLDQGLKVSLDGFRAMVEQFETVKRTRFFGLSSSTSTDYDPAGKAISGPIRAAYEDLTADVLDMARTLGKGRRDFRDFAYSFDLSLKDMTDEEKVRAVQGEFGKVSDKLARMAGASARFAEEGETATQTLTRMVASFGAVQAAYATIFDVNLKAGESATRLAARMVQAAGGLDAFQQATEFYVQNFLSLSDQAGEAGDAFLEGLSDLGLQAAIGTREAFTAALNDLQARGMGKKAAGLLALADDFDRWQDLLAQSQQDAIGAAEDAARRAESIADQRRGLEERLLELQGNTTEMRRRELEAMDESLRPLQQSIYYFEDMKRALDAFTEEDYATRFDFLRAEALATGMGYGGPSATTPTNVPLYSVPAPVAPSSSQSDLLTELRALRAEVAALRSEQLQIGLKVERNTAVSADLAEQWDAAGLPTVAA